MIKEKEQAEEEFAIRLEQVQSNLKVMDAQHFSIRQYILMLK